MSKFVAVSSYLMSKAWDVSYLYCWIFKGEGSFDWVKKSWSFAFSIHYSQRSHFSQSLNARFSVTCFPSVLWTIESLLHQTISLSILIMIHYFNTHNSFFLSNHIQHQTSPLYIHLSNSAHAHIKMSIPVASLLSISKPLIQPRFNTNRRTHRPAQTSDRKTPIQCATIRTFSCHTLLSW